MRSRESQICLSVSCLSVSLRLLGAFCLVCSKTRRYPFLLICVPDTGRTSCEFPSLFGGEHHPFVRSLSYRSQPSFPSTSYPSFLSFVVPCCCKCKWDAPPGVSSLGSATQHDEGGRRPQLSNSTAVADDSATTATTTSYPSFPSFVVQLRCKCK